MLGFGVVHILIFFVFVCRKGGEVIFHW